MGWTFLGRGPRAGAVDPKPDTTTTTSPPKSPPPLCPQVKRCLQRFRQEEDDERIRKGYVKQAASLKPATLMREEFGYGAAKEFIARTTRTNIAYGISIALVILYVIFVFGSWISIDHHGSSVSMMTPAAGDSSVQVFVLLRRVTIWAVFASLLIALVVDRTSRFAGKMSASRNLGKMLFVLVFLVLPIAVAEIVNDVEGAGSTRVSYSIPVGVFMIGAALTLVVMTIVSIAKGSDVRSSKAGSNVDYIRAVGRTLRRPNLVEPIPETE